MDIAAPSTDAGAGSPVSIDVAIRRVRAWRSANEIPPSRFAAAADLSETTTRDIDKDSWNPTRRTLEKLESLIPAEWREGDSVPDAAKSAKARAA